MTVDGFSHKISNSDGGLSSSASPKFQFVSTYSPSGNSGTRIPNLKNGTIPDGDRNPGWGIVPRYSYHNISQDGKENYEY